MMRESERMVSRDDIKGFVDGSKVANRLEITVVPSVYSTMSKIVKNSTWLNLGNVHEYLNEFPVLPSQIINCRPFAPHFCCSYVISPGYGNKESYESIIVVETVDEKDHDNLMIAFWSFAKSHKYQDWIFQGNALVKLTREGEIVYAPNGNSISFVADSKLVDTKKLGAMREAMAHHVGRFLFAMTLANCKNVNLETVREIVVPNIRHLKKSIKKKDPCIKEYVLNISPMKKVLKNEGRIVENGTGKALHLCRGHFKDYREHGLFGKEKGVYWWDAHVRGKTENGVVEKDYRVLTE